MKKEPITYSISKAGWHTERISKLQNGQPIAPTLLQVDLEAFCNDSCEFCAYRKEDGYNNVMLDLLQLKPGEKHGEFKPLGMPSAKSRLAKEYADLLPELMARAGIPAIEITGGGEPTLWPWFDEFIANLQKHGIEIGLVTNGSTMTEQRAKLLAQYQNTLWIRFSMDSCTPMTHKKLHRTAGYEFSKRVEAIKRIVKYKHDELELGISFITTPNNYHEIEESIKFYSTLGVSHIRVSFMYDKQGTAGLTEAQIDTLLPNLEKWKQQYQTDSYAIYFEKDRISSYSAPNTDFNKCYMQDFVWAVGADSNVYPCCIMKYHPDFSLGKLENLDTMVSDLEVLAKKNNLNVNKCFPCWLRSRNKSMASYIEKPKHANFV